MTPDSPTKRHSQFTLLRERRFGPFFGVQFLGAFNDNVFKQALVILLAYNTASFTTLSSDVLQNVAQALFILPFVLFSATAGQIADKYEKSRPIAVTVALELLVMMIGAVGFFAHNLPLLLTALFLGGLQSTLFGPVKYAILPQQLAPHELVGGNALVESATSVGLVPFGAIGLTVFGIDLAWSAANTNPAETLGALESARDPGHWRLLADLALIGVFGGLYIVPLYALVQSRSDAAARSRTIAGNNILNALFIVAAAVLAIVLFQSGASIPQLILITAVLNAAVAVYIFTLVPEFLMRFMAWVLIHPVYRLEESGIENIPERGPALLVCNHVSYVDAMVILAASPRPIRFVMDHNIFRIPLLSFFFRTAGAIAIAPVREDRETLDRAFDQIAEALERGELVGIFPEGRLTSDGEIGRFQSGTRRILKRSPVPVIPIALSGLWQSLFFARSEDKLKHAGRLFPRIRISVGAARAASSATPDNLRAAVTALRGEWR